VIVACALQLPVAATASEVKTLRFDDTPVLVLRSSADEPYLTRLRETYKLADVVAGAATDYDRVRAVSRWVRTRWNHNGSNTPEKNDPISILEEAATGKKFRCVEYAVVLAAPLNAIRIPARVLALATEDVETRESGAGHVVTEAWLADRRTWIMVDGQFDVIPLLDGRPLNAVELQRALAGGAKGLSVATLSDTKAETYFDWVAPYLYFFHTALDARYPAPASRTELCLLPLGAKPPTVFQKKWSFGSEAFTHSVALFYAPPRE